MTTLRDQLVCKYLLTEDEHVQACVSWMEKNGIKSISSWERAQAVAQAQLDKLINTLFTPAQLAELDKGGTVCVKCVEQDAPKWELAVMGRDLDTARAVESDMRSAGFVKVV